MTTEIQQNRYDQLLRRVGGLIGPGSKVSEVLSELFPVLDVESLNAELAFLAGWRLAFGSLSHNGSSGDLNHVQLFNPVGSGMIVVLERVDFRSDLAQTIRYGLSTVALADFTANEAMRDTRQGILLSPVAQLRDVQQVGGIAAVGQIRLIVNVNQTLKEKKGLFVLAPGTGVTFASTVITSFTTMSFLWRERVAEPSELNV